VRQTSHAAASAELAARDPVMAGLVAAVGPCVLRPPRRTAFEALVRAIVYQQLSGRSAAAIYARLEELVGDQVSAERILAEPVESLRRAGLSAAKAASVADLAAKVADGTLPLGDVARLSDDELVERLVVVRGIGRWTAEMFLIFQLRRLDVWPVDDLGVRKGYARAYRLPAPPAPAVLGELGEPFRPYRSVAAWYCWRAAEMTELPGG
jgi:DNA-3-methyladenine glycosylase II